MPPGWPPTAPFTTPGKTARYDVKFRLLVGRSISSRVATKPPTSLDVVSTSGASALTATCSLRPPTVSVISTATVFPISSRRSVR